MNAGARRAFIEDPEKFLPAYNGYCVEGMSRNKRYPADPTQYVVLDGRTYFCYDEKTRIKFLTDPRPMIAKADANWLAAKDDQ